MAFEKNPAAGKPPGEAGSVRGGCRARRRLWITFWSQFSGVFLGGFLKPTGLGASVRGDFSPKDPRMVRWASADLGPFSTFFAFFDRFLPVFGAYFALFPSMPCAYLYVSNFFSARLAWKLRSLQPRRAGAEHAEEDSGNREPGNRKGDGEAAGRAARLRPGAPGLRRGRQGGIFRSRPQPQSRRAGSRRGERAGIPRGRDRPRKDWGQASGVGTGCRMGGG